MKARPMRTALRLALAAALLAPVAAPAQQSLSQLDGARYAGRHDHGDGDYTIILFRVTRNSVVMTQQVRHGADVMTSTPNTYPVSSGVFYIPNPKSVCLEAYLSDECGAGGTITNDEIRFTLLVDGRPSSARSVMGPGGQIFKRQR
jgi:hypothetical protein